MLSGSYGRFVTGLVAVGDPRTRVYASTENERKFANRESVFCRRPLNRKIRRNSTNSSHRKNSRIPNIAALALGAAPWDVKKFKRNLKRGPSGCTGEPQRNVRLLP